jgi:DNA transposition AAA+ family ATPase
MNHDLFSRSEQDARIQRASRMIPDGPIHADLSEQILNDAARYMSEHGITYAALASSIGTSQAYVSTLFSRGDLPARSRDKLLRDLAAWMEEDFRHRSVKIEQSLVMTVVANRLSSLAKNVKATRDIGIGYSPAGTGKTICAKALTQELPGTIYVYVDRDCRSESGLLKRIYATLRKTRRERSRAPMLADIVEELAGTGRLLIIDQAHDLRDAALGLLMNLHDQAELPILLLGTIDTKKRVDKDADPLFGQMSSRVGPRLDLCPEAVGGGGVRSGRWLTVADVRKIFRGGKIRLSDAATQMLWQIATSELGYLRRASRIHRWAEFAARTDKKAEILASHIEQAIEWVDGVRRRPASAPSTEREAATA